VSDPVQISAHDRQAAPGEDRTIARYRAAVAARADYVEFDIRRTADDELVTFHDPRAGPGQLVADVGYRQLCDLAGYEVPKVADALAVLSGRARGHLDLKDTGNEDRLVRLALDLLGPGEFIITTPEDSSVAAIRSRFRAADEVPVALTLGRGAAWPRNWRSVLRRLARVRECGANWVAVEHRLAAAGVAGQCRRQRLKVMVWTVNQEPEIRYWLARTRIDVLVTDRPALAVALRDRRGGAQRGEPGWTRPAS
jgi:glycerophosphoryl diester phosphodiesterase